jgi:hypothetical protein
MKFHHKIALAAVLGLAAGSLIFTGCEGSGKGDPNATVGVNFTGSYKNCGGSITTPAGSPPVTELALTQQGTALDAVDNNGTLYSGSLGGTPDPANPTASFNLSGALSSSNGSANISGTLKKTGDTLAQMTGSWLSPTFHGTIKASAVVAATVIPVTNAPPAISNNVVVVVTNSSTIGQGIRNRFGR